MELTKNSLIHENHWRKPVGLPTRFQGLGVKLKLTQTSNGQKGKSPLIRGTPIAEYETR
jgi:hypothetical protein